MSDILATSEELTKIIERAVNRIGENHALARDNEGITLTNNDSTVIEEALEDAAKDMAEKMVLEQNIDSIVKEQVKAMGSGSGFIGNQGTSSSLEKFNKRQEMGESEEKSEEEVEEATTAGMAGAFVAPLASDSKVKKENIEEDDSEEVIDMGGDMIDPETGELLGIEEQISESTIDTIKKLVRKKLSEAKNVSIPGYEKFEKARKESTKETKAYHKDFEKKFKDYSSFKGNDDPKFPFAEHSKENADGQYQYYRNDETQDEFVDDWRGMGLEDADGVGDIGRLSDYLDGSSETGNAQVDKDGNPLGNVVPSELGEKIKKKN